mgnify:FL=1
MPHIDVADSVLLVIDAQDRFYGDHRDDVDRVALRRALDRAAWVCGVARALDVPSVVTEEDAETNGRTDPAVRRARGDAPAHDKTSFGAAANPAILDALSASSRRTVVVVGLETDVCVAQSAIGLRETGLRVVVVRNAVFSAGEAHGFGLLRLAEEGIELLSAKELYYEWLRTLARVRAFDAAHPDLASPPGFSL